MPAFACRPTRMLAFALTSSALILSGCCTQWGCRNDEGSVFSEPPGASSWVTEPEFTCDGGCGDQRHEGECEFGACCPGDPCSAGLGAPPRSRFALTGWLCHRFFPKQAEGEFPTPHSRFHPVPTRPVFAPAPPYTVDLPPSVTAPQESR